MRGMRRLEADKADLNLPTMISIKVHKAKGEYILAACDHELLGREFREHGIKLGVPVEFYFERLVTEEEFLKELERSTIANLIGERTINAYTKKQGDCKILWVEDVPHLQIYKIP